MNQSERLRRIEQRSNGYKVAKRTKSALARIVDALIESRPPSDPEQMEISAPLQLQDTVSDKLARVILRHWPDEVTSRMRPSPYEVDLAIDTKVEPPVLTVRLSPKK